MERIVYSLLECIFGETLQFVMENLPQAMTGLNRL